MRAIGFSTGSLDAKRPFEALSQSIALGAEAVELSALRTSELDCIAEVAASPILDQFRWVSVHAPSRFEPEQEGDIVDQLMTISRNRFPVIVHPDSIHEISLWRALGEFLVLENMDRRKVVGRFAHEFRGWYEALPEAGLCLDLAHARQIDATLVEAYKFVSEFSDKLREIHFSEVDVSSAHRPVSLHSFSHMRDFIALLPPELPVIIESVVDRSAAARELDVVRTLFGLADQAQASA